LQMFPRLLKASVAIFVVGALYQGANAVFAVGPQALLATAGALALTVAMQLRREHEAWLWSALVVGAICMASAHLATTVGFPMAAVALMLASRHHAPRVMTAGLLAAAVPSLLVLRRDLSQGAGFGHAADVAIVVVVTVAMVWLLWQRRAPSALLALAIVHQRTVTTIVVPALAAQGSGTWGIVLVGAGFALLPLGVVAHRRLSQLLQAEDEARAADDSTDSITLASLSGLSTPATSVSPGV